MIVKGKNTIKSASGTPAFYNKKGTTISSYNKNFKDVLDIQCSASNRLGLYLAPSGHANLTIQDRVNVMASSPWIAVGGNNSAQYDEKLTVDDATLYTDKGGVKGLASLELKNCRITIPSDGEFSTSKHGVVSGNTLASEVLIRSNNDATAIEAVEIANDANDADVKAIYDAAGRETTTAKRGLNIVRMSDGSVRKVMVK